MEGIDDSPDLNRTLRILGIRGIPAAHGGFETFAEKFALYMVRRGWDITVYCQEKGDGPFWEDRWEGVRRIHIPVKGDTSMSSIRFDWKSIRHAAKSTDLCLTLGYNTAIFCTWLRWKKVKNIINMDGIEWARKKWGLLAKAWFFFNEVLGCWLGNHLIADHPEIANHLAKKVSRKSITTIPYGAKRIVAAEPELVRAYGLQPGRYAILIARPEPENSILEVVRAWSSEKRPYPLVVLGRYNEKVPYHREVQAAAGPDVLFPGAIYEKAKVEALRFHTRFYVHGHQVGGTNPSLVEALGAGNAVLAHDNKFNRWVVGNAGVFFKSERDLKKQIDHFINENGKIEELSKNARKQHVQHFTFEHVHVLYEIVLKSYLRQAKDAELPVEAETSQLVGHAWK
jgi:hypothetical protein